MRRWMLWGLWVSCLGLFSTTAQAEIRKQVFDNGFTSVLWQNPDPERSELSLTLLVRAGSLQESDEQLGYAHFVEHMAFNGTRDYPKSALQQALKSLGLSIGRHTNASTGYPFTRYDIHLDVADEPRLLQALDIVQQWARWVSFDAEEVAREKPVILEEWRLSEPLQARWRAQYRRALNADSRYGERKPIGSKASIEQATAKGLKQFYQRWYQPHNSTLIVTGKLPSPKVAEWIRERFADWPASQAHKAETYNLSLSAQQSPLHLLDPLALSHTLSLQWFSTYQWPTTLEQQLSSLVPTALMHITRNRLEQQEARYQGRIGYVSAWQSRHSPAVASLDLRVQLPTADAEAGMQVLAGVWKDLRAQGVQASEVEQWRARQLQRERQFRDDARSVTERVVGHQVFGSPLYEQADWLRLLETQLASVDHKALNAYIRQHWQRDPRWVWVSSQAAEAQTPERLDKLLAEAEPIAADTALANVPRWAPEARDTPVPQPDPEQTETGVAGVTQWRLPNGLRVRHRHSAAEPGQVYWSLWGQGGLNRLAPADAVAGRLLPAVLGQSGLGGVAGVSLSQWREQRGWSWRPFVGFSARGVNGSGPAQELAEQWGMLQHFLQRASVQPEALSLVQTQTRADMAQLLGSSRAKWLSFYSDHVWHKDPALAPMGDAALAALDVKRLQQLYQQQLAGAQNYVLAVVGDIEAAKAWELAWRSFAQLPASEAFRGDTRAYPHEHKGAQQSLDGSGRRSTYGQLRWVLPKTQLASHPAERGLLEQWLNDALMQRIREQLGLAYTLEAYWQGARASKDAWTLLIEFSSEPSQAQALTKAVRTLLAELQQQPPSAEQLAVWRRAERDRWQKRLISEPERQARRLARAALYQQRWDQVLDIQWQTPEVAPERLVQLLRQLSGDKAIASELLWTP